MVSDAGVAELRALTADCQVSNPKPETLAPNLVTVGVEELVTFRCMVCSVRCVVFGVRYVLRIVGCRV